jgi:hypothetical protein
MLPVHLQFIVSMSAPHLADGIASRQLVASVQLRELIMDHVPSGFPSEHHVFQEQLFRGNEYSVQGRFNANVCHPITSVCRSQAIMCRFGDAKACNDEANPILSV